MGGKAKDPNKEAIKMQKEQMERLKNLSLPELEEYMLQNPELVGLLEAEQLGPSAMEGIRTDARLKSDQMSALEGLRERSQTGLTEQDKFAMEELMGQVGAQEKSQRASIEQEMARRGTEDSGTALMSKLQGSTSGANSARQQAMQMAAQGQNQRMAALQGLGQQAGSMEERDFAQQGQVASAKDRIAQANAMNRQNTAAQNLAARQNIENQRAGIANQQAQVRNQINQQRFANEMSKVTGQGQVASNMSQIAASTPGSSGSALGTVLGGAAGFAMSGGNPMGAGVGASMGNSVGSMLNFEDGGIVQKSQQKEDKEHERFKKEYMKRVRDELMPQKEARKEVTGVKRFQEGGMVDEDPTLGGLIHDFSDKKGFLGFGKNDLETNLKKGGATGIGVNNDLTDINTNREANIAMANKAKNSPNDSAMMKQEKSLFGSMDAESMGAMADVLKQANAASQPQKRKSLKLNYQGPQVQNVMSPSAPMQFDNPMSRYQPSQFKDGGLYKGTKCAEDGDLMFESTGDSAVVGGDSYANDRVDARLNSGEAVLNVAQQQRLMDILRGKEDLTALGDDDIVEGVPSDYQEELKDKVDGGKDLKMEGLRKLLKALGE
jgi:hypothetical protein